MDFLSFNLNHFKNIFYTVLCINTALTLATPEAFVTKIFFELNLTIDSNC